METPCLRIKFTPMFKQHHRNNSKCLLEIVPEVSCIQNFDKIEWKEENNLIEYIIPMTYRIILKKKQTITNENNDIIKTYHSCVDLPLLSSIANLSLASGDVPRITSDTLILTKFVAEIPNKPVRKENFVSLTKNPNSLVATDSYPGLDKVTNTSYHLYDITREAPEQNIKKSEVEGINLQDEHEVLDKIFLDKITGTESNYIFSNTVEHNQQAVLETTKPDIRCRLSLTPICSIDTQQQDSANITKIVTSQAIICKIYESQKDSILLKSFSSPSPSDILNRNHTLNCFSQTTKDESCNGFEFKDSYRILPEIRIARYVQRIEEEILPLKIILNEIIHKCKLLGLTQLRKSRQNSVTQKLASGCKNDTLEEHIKSNRVVYSIIFDE